MNQNTNQTVPSVSSLPPDTRTKIEKRQDDENGRSWSDVVAAENSSSQNLAEDFSPSATLAALMAADNAPTQKIEPQEDGVALSDGALRVLALAQGTTALTDVERERLDAAEHRADLDRALALAQDNAERLENIRSTAERIDAADVLRRFLAGERNFTDAEDAAMRDALDGARVEVTLSDDPQVNEKFRRDQIAALAVVAKAVANGTATAAQLSRWRRFNTSALAKALKTTAFENLPLDLVKTF